MSDFNSIPALQKESKPILIDATKARLWPTEYQGKIRILRAKQMMPQFKITSEAMSEIWNAGTVGANVPGILSGNKYSDKHYLTVKLNKTSWSSTEIWSPHDYETQIVLEPKSEIEESELSLILKTICGKLDESLNTKSPLEPLALTYAITSAICDENTSTMYIKSSLVFPFVNLQYTPITALKIVSTPLSKQLTQANNESANFQSGFLTLDSSIRVLPLLTTDEASLKYPIVGIWVANVPQQSQFPLAHPLVWAACIRYLQTRVIRERISPNPLENSFLFVHFSNRPKFYEVRTKEDAKWSVMSFAQEVQVGEGYTEPVMMQFMTQNAAQPRRSCAAISPNISQDAKQKPGLPRISQNTLSSASNEKSSISSLGQQSIDSYVRPNSPSTGRPNSPSADKIIAEQALHLKTLEAQIKELQSYVFKEGAQKPPMAPTLATSATNTTFHPRQQSWIQASTATYFESANKENFIPEDTPQKMSQLKGKYFPQISSGVKAFPGRYASPSVGSKSPERRIPAQREWSPRGLSPSTRYRTQSPPLAESGVKQTSNHPISSTTRPTSPLILTPARPTSPMMSQTMRPGSSKLSFITQPSHGMRSNSPNSGIGPSSPYLSSVSRPTSPPTYPRQNSPNAYHRPMSPPIYPRPMSPKTASNYDQQNIFRRQEIQASISSKQSHIPVEEPNFLREQEQDTINVPKIMYDYSSDSSDDDEELKRLQSKYLKI